MIFHLFRDPENAEQNSELLNGVGANLFKTDDSWQRQSCSATQLRSLLVFFLLPQFQWHVCTLRHEPDLSNDL